MPREAGDAGEMLSACAPNRCSERVVPPLWLESVLAVYSVFASCTSKGQICCLRAIAQARGGQELFATRALYRMPSRVLEAEYLLCSTQVLDHPSVACGTSPDSQAIDEAFIVGARLGAPCRRLFA